MIFVTVGSQKFQFDRLLKKIDELIEDGIIKDKVFAQIGESDYIPINYEYVNFMNQEEFNKKIDKSNLIITHAGTGVIVNSSKKGKKIIGVPRLKKFGEHVDDHQIELIREFEKMNFIEACYDLEGLDKVINIVNNKEYKRYKSNTQSIIQSIKKFIEG